MIEKFIHHSDHQKINGLDVLTHKITGARMWFKGTVLHREDGPSIEYLDGKREWHLHGYDISAEVIAWLNERKINFPLNSKDLLEFQLTFL